MRKTFNFENIYIENSVRNHSKTKLILERVTYSGTIQYFDEINALIKSSPPVYHPLDRAKNLVLSSIRGEILRKCPGTHGHICCNYHVINQYIGCPINCTYCILQGYLNQPFTIINVDIEKITDELSKRTDSDHILRIGTGELGDSLVYDHITDFSIDFINFFKNRRDFMFEFKTKTDNIDNLLKYNNPGNIIVGFSMNPPELSKEIEGDAASIEERIAAIKLLSEKNYKISLHFDPIINIPDYKKKYDALIKNIFSQISSLNIAWISMGTFRYSNELKSMIEYNYPENHILQDQFVLTSDNKYRYFRPLRTALYNAVKDSLYEVDKNMPIYLCMESREVWEDVLGTTPGCSSKMDFLFKKRGLIE